MRHRLMPALRLWTLTNVAAAGLVSVTALSARAIEANTPAATGDVAPADAASPLGRQVDEFSLPDVHGNPRKLSELADAKLVAIAFLGTECPLAQVYAPRLVELAAEFGPQGVAFLAVDSNLQDSITDLAAYARVHKLPFPALKDRDNELADRMGARRTPEVFVLDGQRVIRYWGRIDDQYGFQTGAGYAKPRLNRRDLAEAIAELLAGKEVSLPVTKADGCLIGRVTKVAPRGEITYAKHVSRILEARCAECHRPGEIGPFTLRSYDEVVGWAAMIREVVSEGRMPPWFANPDHGHFANDARLTPEEKDTLFTWIDNGCPEGDPSDLPTPRQFVEGWQIGQPDQVIAMSDTPFTVPAEGVVDYQYFTVDPGWTEDKWIKATECRPGNRAVVHHIIVFIERPEGSQGELGGRGGIGGYAPGAVPYTAPEGAATFVPAGSKLRFQMHYTPNGREQQDLSTVGVIFADVSKVQRRLRGGVCGNVGFEIPPGDSNYVVTAKTKLRRDTLLLNMTPHMHLRGKSFRYDVTYPDGRQEVLLDVPRWDFNWQLRYQFAEPKLLPKGSRIVCTASFDNSADNLANPDPNQPVRFGDQTWEEMMFGFYTSVDPNENLLTQNDSAAASALDEGEVDGISGEGSISEADRERARAEIEGHEDQGN